MCTQDRASHAIRVGSHKYIFNRQTGREELFDLSVDQFERENLVDRNAELAALLRSRLEELVDLSSGTAPDAGSRIFEDTRTLELLRNLGYVD